MLRDRSVARTTKIIRGPSGRAPSDATLKDLMKLAGVPQEHAQKLRLQVRLTVSIAWLSLERKELTGHAGARQSLARVARAAKKMKQALDNAHPGAKVWLAAGLANHEQLCTELVENALICAEAQKGERRHEPGRPKGAVKKEDLQRFVRRLMTDVAECGGRHLTLDKNKAGGTLVQAMRLLAGSLPPGFVGNTLPMSVLANVRADWTKNWQKQSKDR